MKGIGTGMVNDAPDCLITPFDIMSRGRYGRFSEELSEIEAAGRLRGIPLKSHPGVIDFTSNDYLGLSAMPELQNEFLAEMLEMSESRRSLSPLQPDLPLMSSSAARLLETHSDTLSLLEEHFANAYHSGALAFNSGYHANVGMLSALGDRNTLILADKLIHASCIDGAMMSRATFKRFGHNDVDSLEKILKKEAASYRNIVILVESVYSMDGDKAPLEDIIKIAGPYDNVLIYIDEAHAIGVEGPEGLGIVEALPEELRQRVDIRLFTLGKALCSVGAVAIMNPLLKSYMLNKARSFIFSTALPPITALWSIKTFEYSRKAVNRRMHLCEMGRMLHERLGMGFDAERVSAHIFPFFTYDVKKALRFSELLQERDIKVMAIRPPTVAAGTERLRISLSAAHTHRDIINLSDALHDFDQNPIN